MSHSESSYVAGYKTSRFYQVQRSNESQSLACCCCCFTWCSFTLLKPNIQTWKWPGFVIIQCWSHHLLFFKVLTSSCLHIMTTDIMLHVPQSCQRTQYCQNNYKVVGSAMSLNVTVNTQSVWWLSEWKVIGGSLGYIHGKGVAVVSIQRWFCSLLAQVFSLILITLLKLISSGVTNQDN